MLHGGGASSAVTEFPRNFGGGGGAVGSNFRCSLNGGDSVGHSKPHSASVEVRRSPMRAECDDDLTDDLEDEEGGVANADDNDVCIGCFDLHRLSQQKSQTTGSGTGSPSGSALSSRSSQISARTSVLQSLEDKGSFLSADASPTNNPTPTRHESGGSGGGGGLLMRVNNNKNDIEMPDFIVDSKTRVTYLKGKFLGKGGFARVHLVTDLTTDRSYAGKIIAKSHIRKRHHMEKITREVELQSTLNHENVVKFYHFFEDALNVYIILENCDRMSLAHELKQRGRLTEDECRYFMIQLMNGLQYIHGQNVVHRDLKLGNMFLTKDYVVKIGDFGLATRHDPNVAIKASICGTPNYIAPEVLQKQGHRFASDVWSLGCSMYAMLVGYPPFETDSLKDTYTKILTNDYSIPHAVSHFARALIVLLLKPEHGDRPTLDTIRRSPFFGQKFVHERVTPAAKRVSTVVGGRNVAYEPFVAEITGSKRESLALPRFGKTLNVAARKVIVNNNNNNNNNMNNNNNNNSGSGDHSKASTLKNEKRFNKGVVVPVIGRGANTGGNGHMSVKMPCNIRMRITRALCPDVTNTQKKKSVTSATLFNVLSTCMENMPDDAASNPPTVYKARVLFIVKWIDYSNRYGFGFELSDHSVGVYFNDSSRMNFSSDRSRLEFLDDNGSVVPMTPSSVPAHLHEKYTLLRYFCQYMDENLTEGGVTKGVVWNKRNGPIPYMKRWLQTSRAIIMQLGNGTLQINFFKDHTKVIVGVEKNDYLVTYINEERQAFTYRLLQIAKHGCDVGLRNRLLYTCNVLGEFATLENNATVAIAPTTTTTTTTSASVAVS